MEQFSSFFGTAMDRLWDVILEVLDKQPAQLKYHQYIHREVNRAPSKLIAKQLINRHCEIVTEDAVYSQWLLFTTDALETIATGLTGLRDCIKKNGNRLGEEDEARVAVANLLDDAKDCAGLLKRVLGPLTVEREALRDFWRLNGGPPDQDEGFCEDEDSGNEDDDSEADDIDQEN